MDLKARENAINVHNVVFKNSFQDIVLDVNVKEEMAVISVRALGNLENGEIFRTGWITEFYEEDGVTFFECSGKVYRVLSFA